MNSLLHVHQFLAAGLRDDPLMCLAQTVVCLDPFWTDMWDDDVDDDGSLSQALRITRDYFPDIYAQVVDALHHGAVYDDLDRVVCAEISRRGIPLDSLEEMGWGVPMPAYGAALYDAEFYAHQPAVVPILEMFGIEPDEDAYEVDVPERVYAAGQRLYDSLVEHPDERYRQVGYLIGWVVGETNNSCVDLSFESLADLQPLSWEPGDFAFAVEIIREADEIMAAVQAGLELVQSNPIVRQALHDNIRCLYRRFARQVKKEKKYHDRPRLHWPPLDGGAARTAESHP